VDSTELVSMESLRAGDRPIKGTLRLRWANGDGGSVKLPSVAGVPLGERVSVYIDPGKMALLLTRVKGGWSTRYWGTPLVTVLNPVPYQAADTVWWSLRPTRSGGGV